ncbi:MAG: clan AA aspartic protease [Blastocatellia bacterium]
MEAEAMMTGKVTANDEAILQLSVRGPEGLEQEIETIIDTGYNGFLTLPTNLIANLNLVWRRRERALLADGSETFFDLYEATVVWDGNPRRVAADAVDADSLLGMSLLRGYEMTIQVINGGEVTIKPLQ